MQNATCLHITNATSDGDTRVTAEGQHQNVTQIVQDVPQWERTQEEQATLSDCIQTLQDLIMEQAHGRQRSIRVQENIDNSRVDDATATIDLLISLGGHEPVHGEKLAASKGRGEKSISAIDSVLDSLDDICTANGPRQNGPTNQLAISGFGGASPQLSNGTGDTTISTMDSSNGAVDITLPKVQIIDGIPDDIVSLHRLVHEQKCSFPA